MPMARLEFRAHHTVGRLMSQPTETVYDSGYFEYQRLIGEFGGWANAPRFAQHIKPEDDVLDFGCGGGYLLKEFKCRRRLGVEISATARTVARNNGVEVYADIASVPDDSVDVIVSNHCLEHVRNPYGALIELRKKLRDNGLVMFVVPCETVSVKDRLDDPNHHLYTFTPLCLGNLFREAGYRVLSSKQDRFRWPPKYRLIARLLGRTGFELACKIWFYIDRRYMFQVRLMARK
jgi:SAM-dependent methyltransferase